MSVQLIEATDLQNMLPAAPSERTTQLALDINTLLLGELPALVELTPAKIARARALVRITLAEVLEHPGVESITRSRGPFSEALSLRDRPELREALQTQLVPALASLMAEYSYPMMTHSLPLGMTPVVF